MGILEKAGLDIIKKISSDTEILIFGEDDKPVSSFGAPSSGKWVVAFDIATKESRLLAENVNGITISSLHYIAPVVTGTGDNFKRIALPQINISGNTISPLLAVMPIKGSDKEFREKVVGYCAAHFAHICALGGYTPEDVARKANSSYAEMIKKAEDFSPSETKTFSSKLASMFFYEAAGAFELRGQIFQEDLLDKFQNGNRFCLEVFCDSLGQKHYSILEHSKANNTLDIYRTDCELFEVAKTVLPQYGLVDIDRNKSATSAFSVDVYLGLRKKEPLLLTTVNVDELTYKPEIACIETANAFAEIRIETDEIKQALLECFTGIDTSKTPSVSNGALLPPLDALITDYGEQSLKIRAAERNACKEVDIPVDISENSLFLEHKRIVERDYIDE